jgi:hypothetical protein
MDNCELVPGSGIRTAGGDIFFGMQRKVLRERLGWKPTADTMWDDEDEYPLADGGEWLRLRFVDSKLCDIEVLGGHLQYRQIELMATRWKILEPQLAEYEYEFVDTEWLGEGKDCLDLQINIATHEDVGGDGDGIEWVIMSTDFQVE